MYWPCENCLFLNPPSENNCMRCFAASISLSHPLSVSDEPNKKRRRLSSSRSRWYTYSTDSGLESNNPDSSVGHNGVDNSTDSERPNRLSSFHRFDNSSDSGLESSNPDSSLGVQASSGGLEFDLYSRKPVTLTFVLPHALSKHANQSVDLFMKENEGVHIKIRSNDQGVRLLSITSLELFGGISKIEKVGDSLIADWCSRPEKPHLKRLKIGSYVLTILLEEESQRRTCFEESFSAFLTDLTETQISLTHTALQGILQESNRHFFKSSFD